MEGPIYSPELTRYKVLNFWHFQTLLNGQILNGQIGLIALIYA